jgi:integrase
MARKKEVKGAYKRGNGWRIDCSYKGIRIRKQVSTGEQAEKEIIKAKAQIDDGVYLKLKNREKSRLGTFLVRYLKWCEVEGQKSVDDKRKRLKRIAAHFGTNLPLVDLAPADIEKYKALRLDSQAPGKRTKIKPATVNRELAYLRHMFTKTLDWGLLDENPMRRVKQLKENNHSLRYLNEEETTTLLDASTPYLRAVITVAVNTGLRYGELMRLQPSDLDFKTNLIEIKDQKNGELSYVPMNEITRRTLRKFPRRIDSPYIFARRNGNPPIDFRRAFSKAVKKAGIAHCRFHDLRHSFASHLAMQGVDLVTIKELMRHKTMAMTLRYAHLSPEHRQRAVEVLNFAKKTSQSRKAG